MCTKEDAAHLSDILRFGLVESASLAMLLASETTREREVGGLSPLILGLRGEGVSETLPFGESFFLLRETLRKTDMVSRVHK